MAKRTRRRVSEEYREDILESLKAFAAARLETIEESRQMRVEAEQSRLDARRKHYDANRVLIQAVKAAYERGVAKGLICEHIGISPQRLLQIERGVEAYDRKMRRAENEERSQSAAA